MEKQVLLDVQERIKGYVKRTPLLSSRLIDKIAGVEIIFKCENFQKGGAYKIRGAMNAVLLLEDAEKRQGVVTHSSGNFAQALALAAKAIDTKAYIVMPSDAPQVKKDAVRGYGGEIIESGPSPAAREETAERIRKHTGATFIHPSNDKKVIFGQGTAAMELLEEHPDIDIIVAPVGGGGLIAGTSLTAHHFGRSCKVVGGEPFAVDDAFRSLASGHIETNASTDTIADGLKTNLGDQSFPIIKQHVDRIIRVTEDEIVNAMHLIWERMKIVVEPSSAVALAAVLSERDSFEGKKTGIIISGGNVDLRRLPF